MISVQEWAEIHPFTSRRAVGAVIDDRVGGGRGTVRRALAAEGPPKDPTDHLAHLPGDQAQCDVWFPPARIPLRAGQFGSPPVLGDLLLPGAADTLARRSRETVPADAGEIS